jgi:cbb3-type cytochrome oxidase subunit 3
VGAFKIKNFNVYTAVIATLMMARFFHEGQVVEAYRGFELAVKKAALPLLRFVAISLVIISLMAYIHFTLFGPFTDLYDDYPEAVLVTFSTFATGMSFDRESFEYQVAPIGYIIFYLIAVILMYLILSQFFIAIIVSAYADANAEEEENEKNMRLDEGYIDLHPALGRRVWYIVVYFFTGYSLEFACFMPGIGLARMLDDLSDEVNDRPGVSERTVDMEEVQKKLSSCGYSQKTIDAVMDTYGQLVDLDAPEKDTGVEAENSSFNENSSLSLNGDLDTATLKEVLMALQNGQAKIERREEDDRLSARKELEGVSSQMSQLQSAVELLTKNVAKLSQPRQPSREDVAAAGSLGGAARLPRQRARPSR